MRGSERRKAERERRIKEQQEKELQIVMAEKNRIREVAEAEKMAHKLQIEKLEAELRRVRSSKEQDEQDDAFFEKPDEKQEKKKRGRLRSLDSRHGLPGIECCAAPS
jgi:hypothetical protein